MHTFNHKPFIHLFYGNGRGKTSAAAGTLVRCWMHHPIKKDYFWIQFFKNSVRDSGETRFIYETLSVPVITVNPSISLSMYRDLSLQTREEIQVQLAEFWNNRHRITSRFYRLVVLDEVLEALQFEIFNAQDLLDWVCSFPAEDIILTGHNNIPEIHEEACYITEFVSHSHPYQKKRKPRKGVEF